MGVNQFKIDGQILSGRKYNVDGVVSFVYGGFAIILQSDDEFTDNIIGQSPNGQTPFTKSKDLPKSFKKYVNKS